MTYRVWLNDERTVIVRLWDSGTIEVAIRGDATGIWGPPVYLTEERDEISHAHPDAKEAV